MKLESQKKSMSVWWSKNLPYLLMALPGIVLLFIFNYLPMFGTVMAFKDYNYAEGFFASRWVGFQNFTYFFTSNDAVRVLRNTILYNIGLMMLVNVFGGIIIALLMYEVHSRLAMKVYQTALLLPTFVSWVIVAYIGLILLNPDHGIVNIIMHWFGSEGINWYAEPEYWPFILAAFDFWKNAGMASLYFYAALLNIDVCLFEAAALDGAGRLKQVLHISIPEMLPMTCVIIITRMGGILGGEMGMYYQMTMDSGSLYPTTDVLATYLYRGLATGDFSTTAAVGLFQSVVGLILVYFSNTVIKKISPQNAMF